MKKIYLLLMLLLTGASVWAQSRIITGKVRSADDNQPLPGVAVTIKGVSGVGTVTDFEGSFKMTIGDNARVIVLSFVGMKTREVEIGTQSDFDIVMQTDTRQLQELVITSFGIEKSKQEIGYAVQEVKGAEVAETNRPNFVNALQGRVAGLNVGVTSGMPGASSALVLRGGTSIGSNNQPLFVVDGVPVDNTTLNEGLLLNDAPNRQSDYTNRIADLDPNDIESITVLKGPAASALYGIDAANGAIIITTKRGQKGSTKVEYATNFMWERITRFPETQTRYGLGSLGVADNNVLRFWGPEIPANTTLYNNIDNFFGWGNTNSHNLSVSGGSDNFTYLASGNILRQNGSIPSTGFDRNSLRLNTSAKLSNKITMTNSVNFTNSLARRAPATKGAASIYYYALVWPRTDDMRNWRNPDGVLRGVLGDGDDDTFDNPYFTIERNKVTDNTDRILLNNSLTYDVLPWLNITGRLGVDMYSTLGTTVYDRESWARFPNRGLSRQVGGLLSEYQARSRILNSFVIATARKSFGDFNTSLSLGHNMDDRTYRVDSRYGEGFLVPDLYSISNTNRDRREQATKGTRRRLIGVFGEFKADYKNMAFLSITGRNDWSSTLPKQNNSFFYPSVSGSFIITEAVDLSTTPLSYVKVRAAFAQVGKDAPPHQVLPALQEFTRTGGGYNIGFFGPNDNIKPETTTSYEIGTDIRLFNNRVSLDLTYYQVRSRDQIVQPRLSYASGYILQLVNAGEIENKGLEILLTGAAIKNTDFSWNITGNFALNRNKVISLPGGFPEFYLSDTWLAGNVRAGYIEGQPFTSFTGNSFRRNDKGELIIGANGYPIRQATFTNIGNRQPKFNLGLINSFRYKSFALNVLFDIRRGGDILNATDWALTSIGLSKQTLERGKRVVFEGVTLTGERNTQEVELNQNYYTLGTLGLLEERFIERDINWLRLRDITISYNLPKPLVEKTKFIKDLQINVTGNNLLLLTNYTGADPDVNGLNASARGSGAVGFDYFSVAAPISLSVGLRASF